MDNNMEGIQDESGEWLSLYSSGSSDIISPRVGDQYQVELPPLMTNDELLRLMEEPVHFGVPIPVTWVHDRFENMNGEASEIGAYPTAAVHVDGPIDPESSEESHITINSENATDKVKTLGSAYYDGEEVAGDKMEIDLVCPQEKMRNSDHGYERFLPVPSLSGEAWKDIERDSFLLGLYIFGKNLCLVKKFVGSKGMGEILSYYHGKFYRSSEYRRWSECRKNRNRRCIYGERIFTSWRQQELLSRFSSHVSEEYNNRLIEVSRIFGEGKISLEEYVLALKDMVGIKVFVEAVAIGKGKEGLTGMPVEHVKISHSLPTGKECSSLSMDEIVKFLTGDIRLSKTRSNDLFWEAVWPRLLARGWHSEQPRNYVSLGSKHSLVFLVPGVKKFSRRRLVKGIQYFDSLTDVLNKVALEPKLLELEPEVAKLSVCKEEEGSGQGPRLEQDSDDFSSRQRHCYLQPRVSQCTRELMKFTIVDTSLVFGMERAKVIELRSLPADPTVISTPAGVSGIIEQNTTKESRYGVKENNTVNVVRDVMESKQSVDTPKCEASTVLNNRLPNGPDPLISATDKHEDQKQPTMQMKFIFSRKVKSSVSNDVDPTTKKHELTACGNNGSGDVLKNIYFDTKRNGEESISLSADNVEINAFQADTFEKPSSANSFERSPTEKIEDTWIDLNLPHVPADSDSEERLLEKLSGTSQQRELFNPSAGVSTEQHPLMNGQRQGTRNRPLTTKALEALACGYLSPKKKRKSVEAASQDNPMSKPPRRVRAKTALLTSCGGSIGDEAALHKMEKGVDGAFDGSSRSHMVCGSRK